MSDTHVANEFEQICEKLSNIHNNKAPIELEELERIC